MKQIWLLALGLCLAAGTAVAKHETLGATPTLTLEAVQSGEAELLDPEVAFALHPRVESDAIIADYFIADGYYAYRDKFSFSTPTPGVILGEAEYPAGKIKDDEFFGRMEIYRHQVSIRIPYTRSGDGPMELVARSQGCADIGVCYPPQTQTVSLDLPAPTSNLAAASAGMSRSGVTKEDSALSRLSSALGLQSAEDDILDPEKAYILSISQSRDGGLQANWKIAEGYYLYQDKMKFELLAANGARLGQPELSKAKQKTDPFFGEIHAYYDKAEARLPVEGPAGSGILKVGYQGCNEVIGVCYPPMTREIEVRWDVQPATAAVMTAPSLAAAGGGAAPLAEQDRIAAMLGSASTWLILLSFFGFGLLLTFTPCVLPMIPILSSIIVGQGETVTTRRAFVLSLIYVLAMASTYAVAGVLVGLSGENIQAWFQNPWVLSSFAALFVLLSLSMFGFYELQIPPFIQERLSAISNRQKGGTFTGVAIMGLLSALIVGPCVTAPLVGALIYIAQTGDAVIGGAALLSLGLGMGVPLLIVGTSAGKLLPRAGAWMESVKAVFGVLILGLAIWMLERILPLAVTMALWAVLLIGSAIYMGALEPLREGASGWRRLWKALGLVMLLHGGLMLIGAAAGGTSLLYPLKGLVGVPGTTSGAVSSQAHALDFRMVKGPQGLQQVLAEAQAQQRPVMLDFYADWCISCKEMEAFTFTDPGVQAALSGAILIQTDVTDNDEQDKALLKQFGLFGPPAILFFGRDGVERRSYRVVGFMKAEEFRQKVGQAFAG